MTSPRCSTRLYARIAAAGAAAVTATAGCAASPRPDGHYPLAPHDSVRLARDVTLTYHSVNDSRCRPDVRCIWAGHLSFRFLIDGPDGLEAFSLGTDLPPSTPRALHGARIVLSPATLAIARAAEPGALGDSPAIEIEIDSP